MGIQKMSLANIKGKLSIAEMKNIMAGSSNARVGRKCSCPVNGKWIAITCWLDQSISTCLSNNNCEGTNYTCAG
jgi:hypothetical protein